MKKGVRLALVICMAIAIVLGAVACTQKADQKEEAKATQTKETKATEKAKATEAPPEEEEALEITGMSIQLGGSPPDQFPEYWDYVEEFYNIDYTVDFVPNDTYGEKLQLVYASGTLPDIMQLRELSEPSTAQAIANGLFHNLDTVMGDFSDYPNLGKINPVAWQLSTVNGGHYMVPRSRGIYNHPIGMFRGDWLEEMGMDTPVTTEEMTQYFVKAKELYPDVIPLPTLITDQAFMGAFGKGAVEPVFTEDGGLVHYFLTEAYRNYLDFHRNLYEQGCMAKEYNLITGSQAQEMFMAGQTAYYGRNFLHWKRLELELQKENADAKVVAPMYAVGPEGRVGVYLDLGFWGGLAVASSVPQDKLVRIVKFFEKCTDPETYNLTIYGVEGIHWNYNDDGVVQYTDKGKEQVNYTWNSCFVQATAEYAKINSPLASAKENEDARAYVKKNVDYAQDQYTDYAMIPHRAIVSDKWGDEWAKVEDEFKEKQTLFVTGKMSYDEFKAYQEGLIADPGFQEAFKELREGFDGFGFSPDNKAILK